MIHRQSILVVEDDRAMREVLTSLLETQGLCVRAAASAQEALAHAQQHAFDVVVSDIQMPGEDGCALLRALRALHPQLPVILMTGFGGADPAAALRAGAFELIAKPFRCRALMAVVRRALDQARSELPSVRELAETLAAPRAPARSRCAGPPHAVARAHSARDSRLCGESSELAPGVQSCASEPLQEEGQP